MDRPHSNRRPFIEPKHNRRLAVTPLAFHAWMATTLCPYCGTGCGLDVSVSGGRVAAIAGDARHPVNRGRTCRKPLELASAVHAGDRALTPLMRRDRAASPQAISWDDAFGHVASELERIRAAHGPEAIAFYISGQLLTEDYYAVNKLAKGYLQTNNVDSNSRLCMSSAVAGYSGAFGCDGPPPAYADLALADCTLLLGSNTAACHPIVWGRIRDRQAEGATVIVADPRATPTARAADIHLPVAPGTDLALLNAMLNVIWRTGLIDEDFVNRHTSGFAEALAVAREWTPERAQETCGVPAEAIASAAERFGSATRAMCLWSMGANQSTVGTLKNRALINLCLATGNLGRPGCGPLSLTGQPNAMGGREVGGLAHLLPGYRRIADAAHRAEVERHWGLGERTIAPRPGLTATELVDALLDGRVRALLIAATNPVVSLPDGGRVREALERAELLVVQDCHHPTETSALAHVFLPAAAWPEKQGTMTNSERRVGLVRRLVAPPGQARADWEIFAGIARALGHGDAFAWEDAAAVYDEFAALTRGRPCDVTGITHERLEREGSVQWPAPDRPGDAGGARLYESRRVHTPDGRARFAPTPHREPAEGPCGERPLMLTTGRLADQWHTMSRTGKSQSLRAGARAPHVELHPDDADGISDGDLVRVRSARGEAILQARLDGSLPRGTAFAPFHFGALHAPAGSGWVNALSHAAVDPDSKQPELKAMAVSVSRAGANAVAARRSRAGRRLVIVGTGMAGQAVAREVVRRDAGWRITMLGAEPEPPYNRILLSQLLAGGLGEGELELEPRGWYERHAIQLRAGCAAAAIDTEARTVTAEGGEQHSYDALVLATGSRPFVPPIDGIEAHNVHVFRTVADARALGAAAARARGAVVLGGGLLGLEAAAGLAGLGLRVDVVEPAPHLMARQLDEAAAAMLARILAGRGVHCHLGERATRVADGAVELRGGATLAADVVVVAAGVVPETRLATAAGLEVARGVVADDTLRTSAAGVWAVGECAEHRGVVYGLWAPLAAQATAAGADIAGDAAVFAPTAPATTLKVAGVDLYAGGSPGLLDGDDELVLRDTRRARYRRLVIRGDRLVGAILLGDVSDARRCTRALRGDADLDEGLLDAAAPATDGGAAALDPDTVVCSCNAVDAATIESAIVSRGLTTLAGVARATGASTGCGGCSAEVESLLATHRSPTRNTEYDDAKQGVAIIEP